MKQLSRRPIAWLVSAVLLAGLLAAVLATRPSSSELGEGVAFRLGDRSVSVVELEQRMDTLTALYRLRSPDGSEEAERLRREGAKSMAVSMILDDQAEEHDVSVSEEDARAGLDRVIADRLGGDRRGLVQFLGEVGVSEEDVLEEVRRTIETSRLYDMITASVPAPTRDEARAEFDANRSEFRTPERRTLRNIVVASEGAALEVLARLRAGESFGSVARDVSRDASTRASGGRLGQRTADELDDAYAAAAFAAAPGRPFGPVQVTGTWHVVVIDKINASRRLSFAESREALISALHGSAKVEVWTEWLETVIRESAVLYADRYRPADPDSAPQVDPTGRDADGS